LFLGVALLLTTGAAYWRACTCGLVNYDDAAYVRDNPHVTGGLSRENLAWALTCLYQSNWHPLTWLSLQLDAQLFGGRAWGFHLTNVLLHAGNVLLLFAVLRRLTGAAWRSALAAALFALHPLHVESVAWVTERKDVLSTFFGLLALAAYARYVRRPGLLRHLLVDLCLALSLMAKPMLVTLPFVLLLLDYWPLRRVRVGWLAASDRGTAPWAVAPAPASWRLVLAEKLPLLALAAASATMTVIAQRESAMQSLEALPLADRLGNAIMSYVRYLGLTVWPAGLAPFYPLPAGGWPWWTVAGAATLLACLSAGALAWARRLPYLAVGWLWYLGTLVPVIGIVQVGEQALADRYTYVPLIGLFLAVAWAALDVKLSIGPGAVLVGCFVGTWSQIGVWRDSRTLWEHAGRVTEDNHVWRYGLGQALLEEGAKPDGRHTRAALRLAEPEFRRAVELRPDSWLDLTALGKVLHEEGHLAEAADCFRRSLRLNPDQQALRYNLYDVGVALARSGKPDEAAAPLAEAVRLAPRFAEACAALAEVLARRGRVEEALVYAERAVRLRPASARYRRAFAELLRRHGETEKAEAQERRARLLGGGPR
jgi:Flp pilus assembly protein TadD